MATVRQWRLVPVILVAAVTFGCGGTADQDGGGSPVPRRGEVPGAPVAPGDPGNDETAIGAPVKLPAITQAQGLPIDAVQDRFERKLRANCGGGELCVTVQVDARDIAGFTSCQFVTTDPPPGAEVDRGTTVVLVTGAQPCTPEPGGDGDGELPDEPGPSGDGGPQPPDETGSGENGSPPPPSAP